jgi:hypothetical protein
MRTTRALTMIRLRSAGFCGGAVSGGRRPLSAYHFPNRAVSVGYDFAVRAVLSRSPRASRATNEGAQQADKDEVRARATAAHQVSAANARAVWFASYQIGAVHARS